MYVEIFLCSTGSVQSQFFTFPFPQDAFIGFGGNVVRESVKALSKWYVYSFQELITELTEAHESWSMCQEL